MVKDVKKYGFRIKGTCRNFLKKCPGEMTTDLNKNEVRKKIIIEAKKILLIRDEDVYDYFYKNEKAKMAMSIMKIFLK